MSLSDNIVYYLIMIIKITINSFKRIKTILPQYLIIIVLLLRYYQTHNGTNLVIERLLNSQLLETKF